MSNRLDPDQVGLTEMVVRTRQNISLAGREQSQILKLRSYKSVYAENVNVTDQTSFWPRGYKTIFMLNSAEHEIILLINVKMPTMVGILTFISMINTTSERL